MFLENRSYCGPPCSKRSIVIAYFAPPHEAGKSENTNESLFLKFYATNLWCISCAFPHPIRLEVTSKLSYAGTKKLLLAVLSVLEQTQLIFLLNNPKGETNNT